MMLLLLVLVVVGDVVADAILKPRLRNELNIGDYVRLEEDLGTEVKIKTKRQGADSYDVRVLKMMEALLRDDQPELVKLADDLSKKNNKPVIEEWLSKYEQGVMLDYDDVQALIQKHETEKQKKQEEEERKRQESEKDYAQKQKLMQAITTYVNQLKRGTSRFGTPGALGVKKLSDLAKTYPPAKHYVEMISDLDLSEEEPGSIDWLLRGMNNYQVNKVESLDEKDRRLVNKAYKKLVKAYETLPALALPFIDEATNFADLASRRSFTQKSKNFWTTQYRTWSKQREEFDVKTRQFYGE